MKYRAANERLIAIEQEVGLAGFLTVADLVAKFGVSEMTVRRDLAILEKAEKIRLSHGGVHYAGAALSSPGFLGRRQLNKQEKERIGKAAASMVRPHDTIAIDAGTTTLCVVDYLPLVFSGTIITHSVPAINAGLERANCNVIGIGGDLLRESAAMVGPMTTDAVAGLRARIFFLGAAAIDIGGIYVNVGIERPTKSAIQTISSEIVLVADHTKFGITAPVQLCRLGDIDVLVTDAPIPADLRPAFREAGVKVVVASEKFALTK